MLLAGPFHRSCHREVEAYRLSSSGLPLGLLRPSQPVEQGEEEVPCMLEVV